MERLLHYVWQHKIFPPRLLATTHGLPIEVIDPGLRNPNSGPDFFNAKVKIAGTLWVGNVELHVKASDWNRHAHAQDPNYDNVILHVVEEADAEVKNSKGRTLPCLELQVPEEVERNYVNLLREERYPPCYHIIPDLSRFFVDSWLSALVSERLEQKAEHINSTLQRCNGDWEQTCFITLARNFGFGVNGDIFELWAQSFPLIAAGKHRDNAFQIEAMFFGQAGLLDPSLVPPVYRAASDADGYRARLEKEYSFLANKFSLSPIDGHAWKFLRMRPQNFPHVRLSQITQLYLNGTASLSRLTTPCSIDDLRAMLSAQATPYWQTHYSFGAETAKSDKRIRTASINLMIINTVVPLLFAYGRYRDDSAMCRRAYDMLESLPAENNFITRSWQEAGINVKMAADSQALIQLRKNYCDRKDCLHCRFGYKYLSAKPNQNND